MLFQMNINVVEMDSIFTADRSSYFSFWFSFHQQKAKFQLYLNNILSGLTGGVEVFNTAAIFWSLCQFHAPAALSLRGTQWTGR
jgi:hypothetical protein